VVTIYDVLPGTQAVQQEKLKVLGEIRNLLRDPAMAALPASQRRELEALYPPENLRVLQPRDLPDLVRYPFTETDGTIGRVVLAYHDERITMWDGKELLRIAGVLQCLHLADGSTLTSSGQPMVLGAMLRSILKDGPRATGLAFAGLVVLVLLVVRPATSSLKVVASVVLGVGWMIGTAGLMGVRVTFLNFIAIPITLGIGAEYALNMVGRLDKERRISSAVATTGAAVVLCSWTTIVGYGSLLAAHSQALRGFGAMAILGEIFCLAAAVVVLPVALLWWRSRTGLKPLPTRLEAAGALHGRGLVRDDVVGPPVAWLVGLIRRLHLQRGLAEALVRDGDAHTALAEPARQRLRAGLRQLQVVGGVSDGVGVSGDVQG
jgi:hypothetical protein